MLVEAQQFFFTRLSKFNLPQAQSNRLGIRVLHLISKFPPITRKYDYDGFMNILTTGQLTH